MIIIMGVDNKTKATKTLLECLPFQSIRLEKDMRHTYSFRSFTSHTTRQLPQNSNDYIMFQINLTKIHLLFGILKRGLFMEE